MFVYAVTQLCPTLVAPCTLPGPSVHRTFLVRILEWVAISSSRGSSPPRSWTCVSCVSCIDRHILYHCAPGNPIRLMGLNYSQVPVAWSLHLCNWNVCVCLLAQSCLTLQPHGTFQALLSMEFSRQGYCSELPFPSPGHLPDPGIKPTSPMSPESQVDSLSVEP